MTNKDLADLIFPNLEHDVDYYESLYPERELKEGEKVTRFAPSPTGYMHIGGFYQALTDYVLAKNSGGIFYLRNEDTDKLREVDSAVELIMSTLREYGIVPDEYEYKGEIVGNYGPYIQSERKDIYHAYIKKLIEIGRAYPCFCTREELDELRKNQDFFIPLSKNQIETELDMRSKYQSLMILLSLTNLISSVLLAFNHDSDLNTMMISLIVMWIYTFKNIIVKTIQFNKERSIRKTHYLYGRICH